jgi:hypothetical protein
MAKTLANKAKVEVQAPTASQDAVWYLGRTGAPHRAGCGLLLTDILNLQSQKDVTSMQRPPLPLNLLLSQPGPPQVLS